MVWELIKVSETEWRQDSSKYYSLIAYVEPDNQVRLDLMLHVQEPVISFQGKADDVRKAAMQHIDQNCIRISAEHAAYIGSELTRAAMLKNEYVQD